jgi:sulfur-carrier protein adenylyltransferase/sulfurtransferase
MGTETSMGKSLELTPDQLRRYVQTHNEKEYLLVDVRQPEEYSHAHIPGARLIPLPQLARTVNSLPGDVDLIFYCHSGGRSAAAAALADEELAGEGQKYNLRGGISAWDGGTLDGLPQVKIFSQMSDVEMFETSMNLEKGAMRFYTHVSEKHSGEAWADRFEYLAKAEIEHARSVYRVWQLKKVGLETFEVLFDRMRGEILEGGLSLAEAMEALDSWNNRSCMRLFELALKIEYTAYDLYRTMADMSLSSDPGQAFLALAQAEKGHMRALIDAMHDCPG